MPDLRAVMECPPHPLRIRSHSSSKGVRFVPLGGVRLLGVVPELGPVGIKAPSASPWIQGPFVDVRFLVHVHASTKN